MKYPNTVLTDSERISSRNFYSHDKGVENYRNIVYYLDLALEKYLGKLYLKNQLDRLIWSDSDWALRKRAGNTDTDNTLNLPFINYKMTDASNDTDRTLFNHSMFSQGIYIPEAEAHVKIVPVQFEYDITFWCNRDEELVYALHTSLFESGNETVIYPEILLDNGKIIKSPAFVTYGISYNDIYSQEDFIVNNKIRTLSIPFTIDTYLIKDAGNVQNEEGTGSDGLNVILTEQVILDFFNSKNINKQDMYKSEMEIFFRTYFTDEGYSTEELTPPIPEP